MIIPAGARVVIVDDQISDIEDLMRSLSAAGVGFMYFNGQVESLPNNPVDGIGIMFLDLELDRSGDDKSKASQTIAVVKKILGEQAKNRSTIIIVWSEALSIYPYFQSLLPVAEIDPLLIFPVSKTECKSPEGNFNIPQIEGIIKKNLSSIPSLKLLIYWDNLVRKALWDIYLQLIMLDNVSDIAEKDKRLNAIFCELAKAKIGEQNANPGSFAAALEALNSMLSSRVSNSPMLNVQSPYELRLEEKFQLSETALADINTIVNINHTPYIHLPGCIFNNDAGEVKISILEIVNLGKKSSEQYMSEMGGKLAKIKHICCETSTLCDDAQKRKRLCRVLAGVAIPISLANEMNLKRGAEYLYFTPNIIIRGYIDEPFIIVFDFRFFFTLAIDSLKNTDAIFQINDALLMHIQNRLGRQVSNPGVFCICGSKK